VVGDLYKPYHPDYDELLATDPENASPLTSPDARRWITMSTEHLTAQRADVLLESAGRDRADFADIAAHFHNNGYRVEVTMMAVNEAHSRLGIVHRYHDQVRDTGTGRLTARQTHDAAYAGMLDAADFIDHSDAVDVVTVVRRGQHVLYANERDDNGRWQQPPATAEAIEAERARRWTAEETKQFADTVTRLAQEMGPRWQSDLADITQRAGPLADPQIPLPDLATDLRVDRPYAVEAEPERAPDQIGADHDPVPDPVTEATSSARRAREALTALETRHAEMEDRQEREALEREARERTMREEYDRSRELE
jgi:hypothetical protein